MERVDMEGWCDEGQDVACNDSRATGLRDRQMIRLLLVDDQPQVLRGLRMRLSLEPDVMVVGEAVNASMALALAEELQPDVVVMDVELPGMDGITATEMLRKSQPRTRVVMLSLHDDDATQTRARAAGASAFVAKHRMEGPLLSAIRGDLNEAAS